jgi:hypothetical protein
MRVLYGETADAQLDCILSNMGDSGRFGFQLGAIGFIQKNNR